MVCPWPALSPQTAFTLSRLKEEEAAGANKLQINAISKESKEEKDPSPAKAKAFSSASYCAEDDCTVVPLLPGFVLRFREIKDTENV